MDNTPSFEDFLRRNGWSWPVWLVVLTFAIIVGWLKPQDGPWLPLVLAATQVASVAIHDLIHRPETEDGVIDRWLTARGSYAAIWLRDNFHLVWMYLIDFGAILLYAVLTGSPGVANALCLLALVLEPWSLGLHQADNHDRQWFGSPANQLIWSALTAVAFCAVAVSL